MWKQNKEDEKKRGKRRKDDLFYILKEYLKVNKRFGLEIVEQTLYKRPNTKEINKHIYQSRVFLAKVVAIENKSKFIKPKREEKYEIEDYFKNLEQETLKNIYKNVKNTTLIGFEDLDKRKRFVVCFKTKYRNEETVSDWESIEVELFRCEVDDAGAPFRVSFTKLDYNKEMEWIFPMQYRYIESIKKEKQ